MSETNMPAAEAAVASEKEVTSYEFAFHVLPTVAEGEVPSVVEILKAHITKAGGQLFDEEAPKRFDLAYDITKYIEGKHRKFSSAYFGWMRFRLEASKLTALTQELEDTKEVLRYLLVKLTKVEEQNPFAFHDSIVDRKVRTISDEEMAEVEALAAEEEVVDAELEVTEVTPEADGKEVEETV